MNSFLPARLAWSFVLLLASCSAESESTANMPDASLPDTQADALSDTALESAPDAQDATVAICPPGSWGNVPPTKCDLIEQDCESQLLTCYPNVLNGTPGTSCTFIGYGAKGRGAVCDSNSECASGLACLAGNCTPFCCPEFQYEICGPGGRCDINLNVGSGYGVFICGYSEPCTLWAHDCPAGETCQPVTDDGSAACSPPATGSFVGEGNTCTSRNDCDDSQGCVAEPGNGSICRYYCKRGTSPYDAGAPDAAPGDGGCPVGQSCRFYSGGPDWLGICRPD